jgi:RND family efflux transporter MFP subunit
MNRSGVDRAVLVLGMLPLLAGGCWLVLLREPRAAALYTDSAAPAPIAAESFAAAPHAEWLGVVVAGQDADLGAELAGQVAQVFVEPGARVRRGEPLLQLVALSVLGTAGIARAQYDQDRSAERAAELALESTRDKFQRMERARDAYSAGDVLAAEAEMKRSEAELAKLRAKSAYERAALRREIARADTQILRAPFDGVLAARPVDPGDFVPGGSALARVVDDARFVRFALPAADHARLSAGTRLTVKLPESSLPLSAAVVALEPELDVAAGVAFARAKLDPEIAASRGVMPGQRVRVLVP